MRAWCYRGRRGNDHVRVAEYGRPESTPGEFSGGAHHIAGAHLSWDQRAKRPSILIHPHAKQWKRRVPQAGSVLSAVDLFMVCIR